MGLFDFLRGRKKEPANPFAPPLPVRTGAPASPRADGAGKSATELARRLGMTEPQLRAIKVAYTPFDIPKRSGRRRRILAPSPELKNVQRTILRRILPRLRAHPAVTGFERGHSIVTNALHHARQAVVVRIDLVEFFPSTSARRIRAYFARIGWDPAAAELLTNLCTFDKGLPQGAPTSPRLSNLVNWELDTRLEHLADRFGARYTRYADDLTFSFETDDTIAVHTLIGRAKLVVESCGYRMHMKRKLHIRRRHQRQEVTGLVVNDGPRLPRQTRRWLRAVEHRTRTGGQTTLTPAQLAGWRALVHMVQTQSQPKPPD